MWALQELDFNPWVKGPGAPEAPGMWVANEFFYGLLFTKNDFFLERNTLQGTNISPQKWHFEDGFPFPKVGYVNSLEGRSCVNWK